MGQQPEVSRPQPVRREGAPPAELTFYDAVGGEETFRRIVAGFYRRVPTDPVLSAVYDLDDLEGAEERLRLFLVQYWGGPRTYSELRGHPRLRMRHVRFRIGSAERDAWLRHMLAAVDTRSAPPQDAQAMRDYFHASAFSLVNQPEA